MTIDDPEIRAELQEAFELMQRFLSEHPWTPPRGPFVVTEEHRRLIAKLEADPRNRDGACKDGCERMYRLDREWLARPKTLLPRSWNPSSNSSAP